jgi:hypothetical protein
MFPGNIELVMAERRKDLLREAEKRRLIKILERERPVGRELWRQTAQVVGQQLVTWGTKLQSLASPVNITHVAEPKGC